MSSERLTTQAGHHHRYMKMQPEPTIPRRIFDELPKAVILSVSRPDVSDITPMLLSYTIEFRYKQFKWRLVKKASQVLYLHFALKKRAIIEEFHEKQEQVKEWLQNLGICYHSAAVQDDEEADDDVAPSHEESCSSRHSVATVATYSYEGNHPGLNPCLPAYTRSPSK